MVNVRKISFFSIITTVLTVLFIAFIFVHSMMNAEVSDSESLAALSFFEDLFSKIGLPIELSNFIVRKIAHFSEFAVLGVLSTLMMFSYTGKTLKNAVNVMFICLATAVADETVQLFVPGRSGRIQDVLIDFSGAVSAIILVTVILFLFVKYRKSKAEKIC